MAESVMRQAMETWLKQECVNTGLGLMHLSAYVSDLQYSMFHYNKEGVKHAARGFNDELMRLVQGEHITSEEATSYKDGVDLAVGKFLGGEMYEVSEAIDSMVRLTNKLDILTLEKTVVCQIGKPEETHFEVGDRVKIIAEGASKDREGAIVDIPPWTNLLKIHLDGDVSPSAWRLYEVEKL